LSKLRLFSFIIILCASSALAQSHRARKSYTTDTIRLDHSLPYVYLKVDHIGPRVPFRDDEPKTGVFLRLHNNCTVPIVIDTFGDVPNREDQEIRIYDQVVVNSPPRGEPIAGMNIDSLHLEEWPKTDISAIFGNTATKAQKPAPLTVQSAVPAPTPPMPAGYWPLYASPLMIRPGHSIYFSFPLNHVSDNWHIEIPFHFELMDRSPLRSPYSFVALYKEDINLPAMYRPENSESATPKPTSAGGPDLTN